MLSTLPPPIRQSVLKNVAGSILLKIPFFAPCSETLLLAILMKLQSRVFLDGDTIVKEGE